MPIHIDVKLPDDFDMKAFNEHTRQAIIEAVRIPFELLELSPPYTRTGQLLEEQREWLYDELQSRVAIIEMWLLIEFTKKFNLAMRVMMIQARWRTYERWKHIDNTGE